MTPKIKEINDKYSDINIVSIAVDDDINRVKKYIAKHNLQWKFGFIPSKGNSENKAIKQLEISYYPTFILIDSDGKIISRGSSDSFEDILKKLNN